MGFAPDYLGELALLEMSRIQREALAYDMEALENYKESEDED